VTTNVDRCSEWRALASCRLDGELDELQTARLESHLRDCAACRAWSQEISALAQLFHESEPLQPARPLELQVYALRRRFARAVTVGATAASAAAVAAFALGVPGNSISPFGGSGTRVSAAPCASCTKKQAVTQELRSTPTAAAPVHVVNPFVQPE
jgi:predicted anti-sigma-YlaC factor YlaD